MRHVVKVLFVLLILGSLATPAAQATGPWVTPNGSSLADK